MKPKPFVTLSIASLICLGVLTAPAANIVWVSDSNDPSTGFFGPLSGQTDSGFVTLLLNAGHNVIRYNQPNAQTTLLTQAELDALNTNDLVIVARCVNSAAFQTGQGNQWNVNITKPLIDLSAFHVRMSRLGWFTANEAPDNTPTMLSALNPNDPVTDYLFGGVAMNGTNTVLPYDQVMDRNSNPVLGTVVAGGVLYANGTYVRDDNTATPPTTATGNFIAGFPAGTAVRAGVDILGGYRMFFSAGSRESATAPNSIPLYTSRENLSPTGEDIFLRAVQVALNNGAAPPTDPSAPLGFTSQPANVTVLRSQNLSVNFSASVTGAAPRTLQWQRDDGSGVTFTNIPDASTPFSKSSYTLPGVTLADSGARFRLVASNSINAVTSDGVTLTVTADTAGPVPLSAASLNSTTLSICFDDVLDSIEGTADDEFHYSVDSGGSTVPVSDAAIRPDGRSVTLTLGGSVGNTFSVTLSDIKDWLGNAMAAPVTLSGTNYGLTDIDVGALSPAGTDFACDGQSFQLTGGGLDIQAITEQFRFAYKAVDGDFDARVRVRSLVGIDRTESAAKALLSARASSLGGAASVNVFVTPPYPGNSSFGATARTATDAATSSNFVVFPYTPSAIPATFPNAWLRIRRVGDVFTTSQSANGTDWSEIGTITVAMGTTALVGPGVNSHRNGFLATGVFSDFSISQGASQPTIANPVYSAGSFTASFQTQSGVGYTVQYKDALVAGPWSMLTTITGDGTLKFFTDPGPVSPTGNRFYQISIP